MPGDVVGSRTLHACGRYMPVAASLPLLALIGAQQDMALASIHGRRGGVKSKDPYFPSEV